MRVLFLNAATRGGAPRSVSAWASALQRNGHLVRVAAPAGAPLCDYPLPRTRWLGGQLDQAGPLNLARLLAIISDFRPDVIHTVQYGGHLLARLAAELTGTAWVHTVLGPLSPGQRFSGGPYLAVSRAFAADAALAGADSIRVVAARLVATTPVSAPSDPVPTVVFASRLDGRLVPVARLVLASFALLTTQARCILAGDGEGLADLRREWPSVAFPGHVADMRSLHARASVLIGAGRTLMEGLAAGVPCINVGLAGFGGVVEPSSVGAIAAHNFGGRHVGPASRPEPGPLAAAIDRVLGDAPLQVRLRTFGPAYAARLAVEAAVPALERAYDEARGLRTTPGRLEKSLSLVVGLGGSKLRRVASRARRLASR